MSSWKSIVSGLCILLTFSTFVLQDGYLYKRQTVLTPAKVIPYSRKNEQSVKKILFYTPYFHMLDWQFGFGHQPFVDYQCPVTNCLTTNNYSDILEFDAVLFHIRDVKDDGKGLIEMPSIRSQHQYYVWFLMESPSYDFFPHEEFSNYFNWTMTYRKDSDFYRPYGWVAPKNWNWHYASKTLPSLDWSQFSQNKTAGYHKSHRTKKKLVAWLVSNCHTHSQRENYVKQLSKYIQVDIYGACGTAKRKCDKNCSEYIQSHYKFYLSFENSICQDYVTEKFWNYLNGKLIPVVLGGADYDQIAPPHSFINALDYKDPQDLADYLNYLSQNTTAYNEYFWWVPYFTIYTNENKYFARAMCQLCEALNNPDSPSKVYPDTKIWWQGQGHCQENQPWTQPVYNYQWTKLSSWKSFASDSANKLLNSLRDAKVII